MHFHFDDGGRAAAGFKGKAGDCVVRAVAIATGQSYSAVYAAVAEVNANTVKRRSKSAGRRSARSGIFTNAKPFRDYMHAIGWTFVPAMGIGTGCRVHLTDGELPAGRLIVKVSKHVVAVIDGVIHDTHDPQREIHRMAGGPDGKAVAAGISRRCVYGYWQKTVREL